ncbi:MAG: 2-oxoacid:ferredoxin oxidoreductase subunit beta [Myxococcales bacterium]|nr:2-oxoacid:ferredoxin oxidoreductase subunit beta [Myxococcales bacterium]
MAFDYEQYLRVENLPHIWCPGCGHGIIFKALLRSIDTLKLPKDDVALVSGIGCASRLPGYADFNTLHTTHGRALPFAIGMKVVKPQLNVIITAGDGDAVAIGGNHFIHTCRRNIDMTLIIFNNSIYGMTGGQVSPTTPFGANASTAPYGNLSHNFDFVKLAEAAGATFVARATTYHVKLLEKAITEGIRHKGFSVIEVLEDCPTAYGRRNKFRGPVEMMKFWKDHCVMIDAVDNLSLDDVKDKIPLGIFLNTQRHEFVEELHRTARLAMED